MPIKPPPSEYEGSISRFVDQYVVPNLPSPDALIAWTQALLDYYDRPNPICVVRGRPGNRGAPRKGHHDVTLVDSDNSPGRWTYLRALDVDGRGQPLTMDFASIDQPCHLARHLRIEFPGARGSRWRHGLHGGCYGHQTS